MEGRKEGRNKKKGPIPRRIPAQNLLSLDREIILQRHGRRPDEARRTLGRLTLPDLLTPDLGRLGRLVLPDAEVVRQLGRQVEDLSETTLARQAGLECANELAIPRGADEVDVCGERQARRKFHGRLREPLNDCAVVVLVFSRLRGDGEGDDLERQPMSGRGRRGGRLGRGGGLTLCHGVFLFRPRPRVGRIADRGPGRRDGA